MNKLIFATNNQHKLKEVNSMLYGIVEVVGLEAIGCFDDIPETADTLEGNALQKAEYIQSRFHHDCFADDTGLEVEALDGRPGVYSARYAGEPSDSNKNIDKLLNQLEGKSNRKARFRTVISLIINNKKYSFEGIVYGTITHHRHGEEGFGYDPIFIPDGYNTTFSQMSETEKNSISHRGRAVSKLVDFIKNNKERQK